MPLRLPKQYHPDFSRPGVKPTGAVEIDYSNPLARGLWICVVSENGIVRDKVTGQIKAGTNTTTSTQYIDVATGRVDFDTGRGCPEDFTVLGCVKYDSLAQDHTLFDVSNQNLTLWADTSGGSLRTTIFADGSAVYGAGGGLNYTDSFVTWGATIDKTNSLRSSFINGQRDIDNEAFAGTSYVGLTDVALFGNYGSSVKNSDAAYKFIFVWDRVLSDAEIASLSRDPYQILKPAQPMMLFLPAGGATGYTLNADVNAATLGSDGVSLLANRTMTADVNSLALDADGVTLSSGITLVADVNTLTVGGDDVALTANRLIGADVNAITLGGDDVTLTYTSGATYTLTADAGAYTVSSDSVDLLANRLLTADARAYILSADSVTLSVGVVDTEDCYVWLQSQITDVAYTVSAINVNNYLVSDVDDTAQYLTSAFGAESIYLESCICHCA